MIKGMEMRKKDFIYFASAAVLLAASVQVAHADEVGVKESAVTESEAVTTQASPAPVVEAKQEVGAHQYVAPASVTELPVTSSEVTKADEPKEETQPISEGQTAPSSESATKPVTGTTTFYSAGSKAPSGRTVSTLNRPQGDLSIENNNEVTGTFDAVVRNVVSPSGLKEVLIPSWSVAGWQDDLIWHKASLQSDGSYRATIKASDHKNSVGQYQVHVHYLDQENRRRYVTETVVEVRQSKPSGTLSIENNNSSTGTFDAVIRDVVAPNGLKEVLVPTWSDKNWQDDLIWHKAVRQSDGSYRATIKASDHKNDIGKYHVHVYFIDAKNHRNYVTETITEVRQVKPSGTLSIENNNSSTGTFDAVVRNVVAPTGLKEVLIPSWSVEGGQDDLIWHKAVRQSDGSYRATIKASDHKNTLGQYQVHVHYLDQNNRRRYATETVVEVQKTTPTGTITIQNNNKDNGTFDVIISNVYSPKGVRAVQVPTWSDVNGQDDLAWYEAIRQSDGTYKLSVKASDHKFSTGTYHVHLYYIQGDDSRVGIGATTVQVENKSFVTRNQLYLKHISAREADGQLGRVLKTATSLIGVETGTPEHLKLVKDYNSVYPLPVGYPVKSTDDWCDVFVTTVFQREGLSHLIGRECGVERHIQIFKNLGIWNEDGASTPKSGDIITFNWDQDYQQNDGWADHIGIVEYVENGLIHTIEGNSGEAGTVKRNVYRIGHGNIRGFATPRYK